MIVSVHWLKASDIICGWVSDCMSAFDKNIMDRHVQARA